MLITQNVFLDTSVIIAHHFDYSSVQLRRLEELAQQGEAYLVSTPIVVAEVEANIRKRVDGIVAGFKRFKKDHPIAKNLTISALNPMANVFDSMRAQEELGKQFHAYMDRTRTELVSLELSSPTEVFDWYFKQMAPFGGGEKKHEFPDAFNISALEKWCAHRKEKLYVVAGDGDLAKYCEGSRNLIRLQRPAEFIDACLKQTADMRSIEDSTSKNLDLVRRILAEKFEALGFYLDDEDGEVDGVDVKEVEVEELSLLDVTDVTARFEAFVHVSFEALISYDDMETSIWDSEEKLSIPMRTIRTRLKRDFHGAALLGIRLADKSSFHSVSTVEFPSRDVPITVNRYER